MNIEIIDVTPTTKPTKSGKGTYTELTVTFKDDAGQIKGKKLFDFANKEVFERMATSKKGDSFAVTQEKNDAGFWNWVGVARQDSVAAKTPAPAGKAQEWKPTYETPEERAKKQVYIVRQSSITAAISYLAASGDISNGIDNLLTVAKRFEEHVFGTSPEPDTPADSFDQDIPF